MIGFGKRLSYAFRCLATILASGRIPEDIVQELVKIPAPVAPPTPAQMPTATPAKKVEEPPKESFDRAVQILALLQRDGRLIDFFTEDISAYSDAQIGAAVRELQQSCRQSLERYVKLEPIIAADEGQSVTVKADFDPATIKMIGNITGQTPLQGVLRHRGWSVAQVQLPPLPEGAGRRVLAPAEVEVES